MRAARRAASPPHGPSTDRPRHDQGVRRRLQRLPAAHRPGQAPGPDLPREALGAADHGARRLPALLPARPARQLGQLPRRDRRRRAAPRRHRSRRPRGWIRSAFDRRLGPTTLGSNAYGIGRDGARGDRALLLSNTHFPWHGLRALVRDPPDDPRQAERDRRRAPGRAGRQPRLHPRAWRGATPSPPRAASRRTSSSCARPADEYVVDGRAVTMRKRTRARARPRRRHAPPHVLRDALGAGVLVPARRPDLGTEDRRTRSPTSTPATSASSTSGRSTTARSRSTTSAAPTAACRAIRGRTRSPPTPPATPTTPTSRWSRTSTPSCRSAAAPGRRSRRCC